MPFNQTQFRIDVFEKAEKPFTTTYKDYPSEPIGDAVYIANRIKDKYIGLFESIDHSLLEIGLTGNRYG